MDNLWFVTDVEFTDEAIDFAASAWDCNVAVIVQRDRSPNHYFQATLIGAVGDLKTFLEHGGYDWDAFPVQRLLDHDRHGD